MGKCSWRLLYRRFALLKGYRKAAEIAQRLLDSLWALLKGCWKATWECLINTDTHWANVPHIWAWWKIKEMRLSASRRHGRIARWLPANTWQFPSLSPEAVCFCLYLLKSKGAMENYKNPQRFSYFCSFQPYHFWQVSISYDRPFNSTEYFLPTLIITCKYRDHRQICFKMEQYFTFY
jgi:hypothetical protein